MRHNNSGMLGAFLAIALFASHPVSALPISEFRKYTIEKQAVYIAGAVSMTAYTYASNGDLKKARCIQTWFFQRGDATPGPRELALEITAAELKDATKFHVEGVILGIADRICGPPPPVKP